MSEEEKNSIREQHIGGMNLMIENFKKLISSKSGDVKPLLIREEESSTVSSNLEMGLKKVLNQSTKDDLSSVKTVTNFCKSSSVTKQPNTNSVSALVNAELSGLDNPINLGSTGGSVGRVANVILKHISGSAQLCSLLKYYSVDGEDFYTAVEGDANGKMDTVFPVKRLMDTFRRVIDFK